MSNENQQDQTDTIIDKRFEFLEEQLGTLEEMFANLMLGYTEISTLLDTLINSYLEDKSPEAIKEFKKEARERHQEIVEALNHGGNLVAESDKETSDALIDLLKPKPDQDQ